MSNNESEFELGWFSKLFIAIIRIMIVAWFFATLKFGEISAIIGSIIFGVIAFYITVWVSNKLKKSISRNYQKLSDVNVVALLMKSKKGKFLLENFEKDNDFITSITYRGQTIGVLFVPLVEQWFLFFYLKNGKTKSLRIRKQNIEPVIKYFVSKNSKITFEYEY